MSFAFDSPHTTLAALGVRLPAWPPTAAPELVAPLAAAITCAPPCTCRERAAAVAGSVKQQPPQPEPQPPPPSSRAPSSSNAARAPSAPAAGEVAARGEAADAVPYLALVHQLTAEKCARVPPPPLVCVCECSNLFFSSLLSSPCAVRFLLLLRSCCSPALSLLAVVSTALNIMLDHVRRRHVRSMELARAASLLSAELGRARSQLEARAARAEKVLVAGRGLNDSLMAARPREIKQQLELQVRSL